MISHRFRGFAAAGTIGLVLAGVAGLAANACGGLTVAAVDAQPAPDAAASVDSRPPGDATPTFDAQTFDAVHDDAAPGQLALGALSINLGTGGSATGTILRAQDQGILIPGYIGSAGFLAHLDDGGVSVWLQSYPGVRLTRVARRGSGYLIGGMINTNNPWIAGVDAQGALVWQETLGTTPIADVGVGDIVANADGSRVFVLGQSIGPATDRSFQVVEVGASGSIVSDTAFTSLDSLAVNDLELLDDGSFAVAGTLQGLTADALVARVTTSGVTWQQRFDHLGGAEKAFAVAEAADGSLCVAGTTEDLGALAPHVWAAKLAGATGAVTWQKTLTGMMSETALSVRARGTGCVVVGATTSAGTGNGDLLAVELGADGSLVLGATYGSSAGENPAGLTENGDGYILAAYQTATADSLIYTVNGSLLIPGCGVPAVATALPPAALTVANGALTATTADLAESSVTPTVTATTITPPAQLTKTASAICTP